MERPVEVGRSVDQYEVNPGHRQDTRWLAVVFLAVLFTALVRLRNGLRLLNGTRIAGHVQRAALPTSGESEGEKQDCKNLGEHGVGLGKRKYMSSEHGASLEWMKRVKALFDPNGILNPGKIFP